MQHAKIVAAALLSAAAFSAWATPCDQIKSGIEDKIKSHGVKAFTLEVVDAADAKNQKVVGSCDGGKKEIVYSKGEAKAAPPAAPAAAAPAPAASPAPAGK
jgi:uncharacterized protein DUF1161